MHFYLDRNGSGMNITEGYGKLRLENIEDLLVSSESRALVELGLDLFDGGLEVVQVLFDGVVGGTRLALSLGHHTVDQLLGVAEVLVDAAQDAAVDTFEVLAHVEHDGDGVGDHVLDQHCDALDVAAVLSCLRVTMM